MASARITYKILGVFQHVIGDRHHFVPVRICFYRGAGTISWEFLSQPPRGAVLGEEGGIWPAIVGSLCFTATAIVLGGIPAVATALFMVFYCKGRRTAGLIRMVIQCISGIPSIVLGLFAYSFLVRDLAWGRCILSSGVALAVMILPFIEVRAEKTFRELPKQLVQSSYALGCSRFYTIRKIVLPACKGEIVSGVILGAATPWGPRPLSYSQGQWRIPASRPGSPPRPWPCLCIFTCWWPREPLPWTRLTGPLLS